MRITTDRLTLNVVDAGVGNPTLLFLHYWGGAARTWLQVMSHLKPTHRCVAFDQRGWGASDAPGSGYMLADLAADALALIDRLQLTRYVLVGHSMGGKVAMLLASQKPAGLEALVLVAPASPFPQQLLGDAQEAQRHAYDSRRTALAAADFLTFHKPEPDVIEKIVEDSVGGSAQAKQAWPNAAAYEDISHAVRNIFVPTVVFVGDHDPQDPPEQQRTQVLPLIRGSQLVVLPDCGHLSPLEQPALLAAGIATFLHT